MQREQVYSTAPSQTRQCYCVVTDSEERARVAVPRKAPGGTRDPPGPAWSPMGVPKGMLEFFFHSWIFTNMCSDPFNTFPHCKAPAGMSLCDGPGWGLPPNKEVSWDRWAEKGTPPPHHAPHLGCSEPSLVSVPAPDRPLRKVVQPSADVSQTW